MKKRLVLFASSVFFIIAIGLWQKERIPSVLAEANSWLNSGSNMYSNVAGNVGIGTTTPYNKLQVYGSLKVGGSATQNMGLLAIGDDSSSLANVGIFRGAANSYTTGGNFLNLGGYDGITFTASSNALGSQTERMRITNNGRVGIGTSNPGVSADYNPMLHVKGAINSDDAHWSGRVVASGPTSAVVMGELLNGHEAVIGGHNAALTGWSELLINPTGSPVGIGTSLASIDLAIGDSDTGLQQQGDGQLAIMTNNAERLRINGSGNVGIGITTPGAKLDINGGVITNTGTPVGCPTARGYSFRGDGCYDTGMFSNGDGDLRFYQNNNMKMDFQTNGDICIGNCN